MEQGKLREVVQVNLELEVLGSELPITVVNFLFLNATIHHNCRTICAPEEREFE